MELVNEYDAVAGDTGTEITIPLVSKSTGAPIDLTGSTVTLIWLDNDLNRIEITAAIQDPPTAGIVKYQFLEEDLFYPGLQIRPKVTDSNGAINTAVETISLSVGRAA